MVDTCVMCGDIIPEGTQVCNKCREGVDMVLSPCKDCQRRTVGCHADCKEYINFVSELKETNRKIRKSKYNDYLTHNKIAGGWK